MPGIVIRYNDRQFWLNFSRHCDTRKEAEEMWADGGRFINFIPLRTEESVAINALTALIELTKNTYDGLEHFPIESFLRKIFLAGRKSATAKKKRKKV